MSFSLAIYLADILNNIQGILVALFCFFGIAFIVHTVYNGMENGIAPFTNKTSKTLFIVLVLLGFMFAIIPSKTTMYMMIGIVAAERVMETPEAKEISNKVLKVINGKLDSLVKETDK